MAEIDECDFAGIDRKIVERFEKRVAKLLSEMAKYNLSIFCGSSNTIRHENRVNDRQLVVGHFWASNTEGGCGACDTTEDGLLRGE